VTFILDGAVAEAAVLAIGLDAMEREASICLVRQQGETNSSATSQPGPGGRRVNARLFFG
jgi:hypothetical protein